MSGCSTEVQDKNKNLNMAIIWHKTLWSTPGWYIGLSLWVPDWYLLWYFTQYKKVKEYALFTKVITMQHFHFCCPGSCRCADGKRGDQQRPGGKLWFTDQRLFIFLSCHEWEQLTVDCLTQVDISSAMAIERMCYARVRLTHRRDSKTSTLKTNRDTESREHWICSALTLSLPKHVAFSPYRWSPRETDRRAWPPL